MSKYVIPNTRGMYIADLIGSVVADMRGVYDTEDMDTPFYDYGHPLEINRQLSIKSKSATQGDKKFPLIALRMDFVERKEDGYIKCKLNIGIFAFTKPEYSTPDRYTNIFKPTLYPLYDLFMLKLYESGLFSWDAKQLEQPKHVKIDRPYYGIVATQGNERFVFSDPLDAIEIQDMEVNSKIKC